MIVLCDMRTLDVGVYFLGIWRNIYQIAKNKFRLYYLTFNPYM